MKWFPKHFWLFVVPLAGISVAAWFYIFRRDKEWERYLKQINQCCTEVNVPVDVVRSVIGRGGVTIKSIQEKTKTRINFQGEEDSNKPFRTCNISGDKENVQLAENMINHIIVEASSAKTLEMWVPQSACGRIIGRNGDNIKMIAKMSNAQINVDRMPSSQGSPKNDEKLIVIKGTDKQICVAKSLIENKIIEDEAIRNKSKGSRFSRSKGSPIKEATEERREDKFERLITSGAYNMIQVYVSSVANPTNFWLQLITPKSGDLDHLVEDMTDYYEKEENRKNHIKKTVSKGEFVATKFSADGKWYRVEVSEIEEKAELNENTKLDIFFLDYGDSNYCSLKDIFELPAAFLSLKFQAIRAEMEGIIPRDGKTWDEESIDAFEDLMFVGQWKVMLAQIVSYKTREWSIREDGLVPIVKLYDVDAPPGVDVAMQLIEKGFAKSAPELQSKVIDEKSEEIGEGEQPSTNGDFKDALQEVLNFKEIENEKKCPPTAPESPETEELTITQPVGPLQATINTDGKLNETYDVNICAEEGDELVLNESRELNSSAETEK